MSRVESFAYTLPLASRGGAARPGARASPDMPKAAAKLARRALLALAILGTLAPICTAASGHGTRVRAERFIISGAAGHLGELTVQALLERGVPASDLILVTRTPERLSRYASLGARVRYGDFTRPQSLRKAFAGGTRMLLISIGLSAVPRPIAHRNAIDAALADGVKHIAYTSFIGLSRGARTGLATDHYRTEQILRGRATGWTMLRNSIYMEELIPLAARMVATGRAVVPAHEDPIAYVAREDCAAAAAAVLATPGHDDRVYDITGPELIGTRELAAAVTAVTGRSIRIVDAPPGAAAPRRAFGGASLTVMSDAVARLTGRPPTTLREFLARHRAELLGSPPPGAPR